MTDKFEHATVMCKANVYFGGKVISHTVLLPDGSRKSLGIILPGSYSFNTDAPERMDITAGSCRVKIDHQHQADWTVYKAGTYFNVPGKSKFEIAVDSDHAEYICSFG
jgi:uncharacterized protein YaiE (UPF0345 family)